VVARNALWLKMVVEDCLRPDQQSGIESVAAAIQPRAPALDSGPFLVPRRQDKSELGGLIKPPDWGFES
jgi:hypothetical protein